MADKFPVAVIIEAVDNATGKLKEVSEKVQAINKPFKNFSSAFKDFTHETGLNKFGEAFSHAKEAVGEVFKETAKLAAEIFGIGAAATFAGFEMVKSFAETGDRAKKASERLGIGIQTFQGLGFAAEQAGIPLDDFEGLLGKFNKNIAEAATGTGDAFVGFNALGIQVRDSTGHLRKMDSLLPEIADKMAAIQNPSVRALVATKLFGREGAKIGVLFKDGAKGLEAMKAEAERLRPTLTAADAAAGEEFNDTLGKLHRAFLGVTDALAKKFLPVFQKIAESFIEFFVTHREQIAAFGDLFITVFQAMSTIVMTAFNTILAIFTTYNESTGKFETRTWAVYAALAAVAAVMSFGLAVASIKAVLSIVQLFGAFGNLIPLLTQIPALFASIGGVAGIMGGIFSAVGTAAGAMWALITGPIGLAIAGIAIVVGLGVLLYKKWEPFRNLIDYIWDKIKSFASVAADIATAIFNPGAAAAGIFGKEIGAGQTIKAATENRVLENRASMQVEFNNAPKGTRITEATATPGMGLDYSMGYSMVSP